VVGVGGDVFAEEDCGLGVVVEAFALGVAAFAVEGYGGFEVVVAVEVDPMQALGAGEGFLGVEEFVGDAMAAGGGLDVEAFALGGVGYRGELAEDDAAYGGFVEVGEPDAGGGVVDDLLDGGGGVAHDYVDGFVVLVQEMEGFFVGLGEANDADVGFAWWVCGHGERLIGVEGGSKWDRWVRPPEAVEVG